MKYSDAKKIKIGDEITFKGDRRSYTVDDIKTNVAKKLIEVRCKFFDRVVVFNHTDIE